MLSSVSPTSYTIACSCHQMNIQKVIRHSIATLRKPKTDASKRINAITWSKSRMCLSGVSRVSHRQRKNRMCGDLHQTITITSTIPSKCITVTSYLSNASQLPQLSLKCPTSNHIQRFNASMLSIFTRLSLSSIRRNTNSISLYKYIPLTLMA